MLYALDLDADIRLGGKAGGASQRRRFFLYTAFAKFCGCAHYASLHSDMSGCNTLRCQKSQLTSPRPARGAHHRRPTEGEPKYTDETLDALKEAKNLLIRMEAIRLKLVTSKVGLSGGGHLTWRPELPTIPMRTFDGNFSEFGIWALFRASKKVQKLGGSQKFSYLLQVLKGSAENAIRRYSITEESYKAALELLHLKYGDKAKLRRVETATAKNNQISEQRNLLEYLDIPDSTAETTGSHPQGIFYFAKNTSEIQGRLAAKTTQAKICQNHEEDSRTVEDLLSELDVLIKTEERLA
ncbi:hypothetical protein OSTOST_05536 [Ostertagia ostertagi]